MKPKSNISIPPSPMRAGALALGATLIALLWFVWQVGVASRRIEELNQEKGTTTAAVLMAAIVVPVLFVIWFIAWRTVKRWQEALNLCNEMLVWKAADSAGRNPGLDDPIQDIATQKCAADERDRFFTRSLNPMSINGFDGQLKEVNPACTTLSGFTRDELLAMPFLEIIHPDERSAATSEIQKLVAGGVGRSFECRNLCKDGSYKWVKWSGMPFLDLQVFYVIGSDVTEQHRTQEALGESNDRITTLMNSTAAGIYGIDLQGTCTFANATCLQMLGYRAADFIGRNIHQLVHNRYADGTPMPVDVCKIYRAFREGIEGHVDDEVLWRADGTSIPVEYWSYPIRQVGQVTGCAVSFIDITKRKAAQDELDRFFNLVPNLMVVAGFDGYIKRVNCAFTTIAGYQDGEVQSEPFLNFFYPDDREQVVAELQKLMAGGVTQAFEVRSRLRDGSYKWFSWSAKAFPERQVIFATAQDVTQRRQSEESLRLNMSVMEAAANGIAIVNTEGALEWVNPAFARLTGYSVAEVIGQNPNLLKSGKQGPAFYEELWNTILAGEVWHGELVNQRKDGSLYNEEMTITPLRDTTGKIIHFVAIKQDITERIQIEDALRANRAELERAKQTAEAANIAKSQFLANMSHEIRTPMNGILGLTELALDTPLSSEQREYLDGVQFSAESLLKLINSILDFSKIEAGKMELEEIDFNLRESLGTALQALALRAHEKNLELLYDIRPNVPDALNGDPARLWQVVINLVGNALKFTQQGEVVVRVELEDTANTQSPDNAVWLHFTVRDTGLGIPADKQALLFKPFVQADSSTTRQFGGTGLGLAISQRLIELMGGRIWLESKVGHGSQFHFTARFGRQAAPVAHDLLRLPGDIAGLRALVVDDNATNRPLHILLAEDNAVNQLLARRMLEKAGHSVVVAKNGQEALERISPDDFDLVLMDVQMPVMDGFEATAAIRKQETGTGRHLPIVAMTANALKGDREKCLVAGMDAYVSKPITAQSLFQEISAVLAPVPEQIAAFESEPAASALNLGGQGETKS